MNGQAGDHEKVAVDTDKFGLHAAVGAHNDPAGDGERAVEPGLHQHTAVLFNIEPDITAALHLGIDLDLERGTVAVARGDHKSCRQGIRDPKSDDRGAAPHDKIVSAPLESPRGRLVQFLITYIEKGLPDRIRRVIGCGTLLQKIQKFFVDHADCRNG